MDNRKPMNKRNRILAGIYGSSMGISLTALALVSTLEIVMLIYSTINLSLYGNDLWKYRAYYISLLSVAVIYLFLYLYVRKDVNHRYVLLNIANPLCTVFFFAGLCSLPGRTQQSMV